jgi:hypothetical protein
MAQPRLINLGIGALLRTPVLHRVASSYVMLLSFTGRKTGRVYTLPVGYFRDGGIVLTTTDDRWWRNLTTPAPVTMLLQGHQHTGMGQAITELGAAVDGMAALVAGCSRYGQWLNVGSTADGRPSQDDLEREVRNGRVLIRISDVEPAGIAPSLDPNTAQSCATNPDHHQEAERGTDR